MNLESVKKSFAILGILTFILPVIVLAQVQGTGSPAPTPTSNTNPGTGITYDCPEVIKNGVKVYGECEFNDFIKAVIKVTKYMAIFALAFSVIVIAWAGFDYMISGNNPSKRADANKRLGKAVTGIIFILLAWLIVTLITSGLMLKSNINTFLK